MKMWFKLIGFVLLAAVTMTVIASISTGSSLMFYRTWAPAWASAEREVYEETQSFVHGTVRDLRNLRLEYHRATSDAERQVISRTILHRSADLDDDVLSEYSNLQAFLDTLRREQ
jgi:hypothetical protein